MCALPARRVREELRLFGSRERFSTIRFAMLQLKLRAAMQTQAIA